MYAPNKKLGQNFLVDHTVIRKMIDSLNLDDHEKIVEIGSGLGILTEDLASRLLGMHYRVFAVEIDERFIPKLENMFAYNPNVFIIQADILDYLPNFKSEEGFKILGSLPFYITSPILHSIIKMKKQANLCVLLVQKEVAKKIANQAPDSSYLSVFVQTFYDVEYVSNVTKNSFKPQPKVEGAIIKLKKNPIYHSLDYINEYENFLHRAFKHPRKMLNKVFSKQELERGGVAAGLRPEALSAKEWLQFFNVLRD